MGSVFKLSTVLQATTSHDYFCSSSSLRLGLHLLILLGSFDSNTYIMFFNCGMGSFGTRCLRNHYLFFFSTAANAYYSLLVVISTPRASDFLNPVKRVDQSTFIPMMIQSTFVGLLKSESCLFW
jgi:hypothetical protein